MIRRGTIALLCVAVVVATGAAVVAADWDEQNGDGPSLVAQEETGFENTVFRIEVFGNGDARWTVEHSQPLETDEEIDQFEQFAERFRTTETETFENFQVRANRLTASGTEVTGREMEATAFERDAFVDQFGGTRGVVQMSFRWTNLAVTNESTVVLADVFDGGLFIGDGQRLEVRSGDDLVFASVPAPEPDSMAVEGDVRASSSVTWFGERQFADNQPRVEFVPATNGSGTDDSESDDSGTGADSGTDDRSTTDEGDEPGDGTDSTPGLGFGVVVALLLLGLGGTVAWYTRVLPDTDEGSPDTETGQQPAPTSTQQETPEVRSDENRVLELLGDNDGRMKQVDIVDETEWSKSKVSMLLSEMEEDGQISKLRVGRENIISIAGEEPDAAGSPFDE